MFAYAAHEESCKRTPHAFLAFASGFPASVLLTSIFPATGSREKYSHVLLGDGPIKNGASELQTEA